MHICVVGFDSAWSDSACSPGAICAIEIGPNGSREFVFPVLSTFDEALGFVRQRQAKAKLCLVAIDQPTIVNNLTGSRPVESVVSSVISYVGGGVQPSNRSKASMFGDGAPIWRFKNALNANDDAEACKPGAAGLFIAEVYPALALLAYNNPFFGRGTAPKYNPKKRKKFRIADWNTVAATVARVAESYHLGDAAKWAVDQCGNLNPQKSDQDKLDAVICALVGLGWLVDDRNRNILIGDLNSGYMISPCSPVVRERLEARALGNGVAFR